MKYENFKNHEIRKTPGIHYRDLNRYRPYLSMDFEQRCCYCNMHEDTLTSPFHIDHFIPVAVVEGKKDDLKTDYENLMWACPKCNIAKGSKYPGEFVDTGRIENGYFYNPVETDYNTIFFRNELGGIDSTDPKGRQMIKDLKLYRPIHNLAWLLEKLESTHELLDKAIDSETDPEKQAEWKEKQRRIGNYYMKMAATFKAAYKSKFPENYEE